MIEFVDLGAQQRRVKDKIDEGIQRVLAHGRYIQGPEVGEAGAPRESVHGVSGQVGAPQGQQNPGDQAAAASPTGGQGLRWLRSSLRVDVPST